MKFLSLATFWLGLWFGSVLCHWCQVTQPKIFAWAVFSSFSKSRGKMFLFKVNSSGVIQVVCTCLSPVSKRLWLVLFMPWPKPVCAAPVTQSILKIVKSILICWNAYFNGTLWSKAEGVPKSMRVTSLSLVTTQHFVMERNKTKM